MAISTQAEAITAPVSRSMARGLPYAGSENARVGAPSSFIVIDPAPAATSGRNSLSHRAPPPGTAAITPVKISAAATGVPNSAPIVADAAMAMTSSVPTLGHRRATSAIARARVDGDDRVLRPQAHPARQAQRRRRGVRLGSTLTGSGGAVSSVVAESWPPWPGSFQTTSPTAAPVSVSTRKIHQRDPSGTPSAVGARSQTACSISPATWSRDHEISADSTPMITAGTDSSRSWRGVGAGGGAGEV